jgi:hypothetical protein
MPAFRHAPIGNWKRYKFDSVCAAKVGFSLQSELANFLLIKKAYNHMNAVSFPSRELSFQPILGAGPSHNCQSSGR